MNPETKNCQNCKQQFVIEPDDFAFYAKIDVPPPTWCSECRLQRRLAFFNERSFYRATCALCKKSMISLFPGDTPYTVYCPTCWWSDGWDPTSYGIALDFSKPFFTQFQTLLQKTPHLALEVMLPTLTNSEYCNIASYLKNCYLALNSDYSEDCYYITYVERSRSMFDMYMADESELCYDSVNLKKCYRTFFSIDCQDCIDVWYSKNLRGCSNCFGCVNMRNKQYHIGNKPYTKEAYEKEIKKLRNGSYQSSIAMKKQRNAFELEFPKKYIEGNNNKNITGDYVYHAKNVRDGYELVGTEDSRYCQFLFLTPTKDAYDYTMWGGNATRVYESMGVGGGQSDVKFSFECWTEAQNLEYCWYILRSGANLFGCASTKGSQYCILNKQYAKEEYEGLVLKIKKHMNDMPYIDALGRLYRYGEFFPLTFSTFAYNETSAQAYLPLTKREALKRGYQWKDVETKQHKMTKYTDELPDAIVDVTDAILDDVIQCAHKNECNEQCTFAFRIVKRELEFYKNEQLPLPRLCPNCRHYERLKYRNPMKLWHRKCSCSIAEHPHGENSCPNVFETSYAPDRPEIVYCETCYNNEII